MGAHEMVVMITAIAGFTSVTIVRQIMKGVGTKSLLRRIKQLEEQNTELQHRTENIEVLVGGMDTELLERMIESQLTEGSSDYRENLRQRINRDQSKQTKKNKSNHNMEDSIRSIASKVLKRVDGYLDEAEKEHQRRKKEQGHKGY